MATILAHITVREGCERRFEAIAAELFDATHRDEAGVQRYEYWRAQQERRYYALLSFIDYRTFLKHQSSNHHESVTAELGDVIEHMDLEWVDPLGSASTLGPTRSQSLDDDATDVERAYNKTMAPRIAHWWEGLDELR
jgi:quinol monooxygenase YgiN